MPIDLRVDAHFFASCVGTPFVRFLLFEICIDHLCKLRAPFVRFYSLKYICIDRLGWVNGASSVKTTILRSDTIKLATEALLPFLRKKALVGAIL